MPDNRIIEQMQADAKRLGWTGIVTANCNRFRDKDLADAYALWCAKAGPDGIPLRRDMTPRAMQSFLTKVALFEKIAGPDGRHRYLARLTGPKFATLMTEMSGKVIDDVVPAEFLPRWYLVGDGVLAYRAPVRAIGIPEAFGRDFLTAEYLFAPLLDDQGKVKLLLAVVNYESGRSWSAIAAEEAAFLK